MVCVLYMQWNAIFSKDDIVEHMRICVYMCISITVSYFTFQGVLDARRDKYAVSLRRKGSTTSMSYAKDLVQVCILSIYKHIASRIFHLWRFFKSAFAAMLYHCSLYSAMFWGHGDINLSQQLSLPHSQHHWNQFLPRVLLPGEWRLFWRPSLLLWEERRGM